MDIISESFGLRNWRKKAAGMKMAGSERRMLAAALTALAAMLLCFAVDTLSVKPLRPLRPLPAAEAPVRQESGEQQALVNINTAGLDELMALPQIGEVRAQAILDYRAEHGPFRYPEELILVKGIGEGIMSGLLDYVTTGGEGDAEDFSGG